MKNLFVFAIVAMALTIFNGCQKDEHVLIDEVPPQVADSNPMFVGLNDIAFSVEDNRLVFENEEEFQKCIDFLAQLGDENFPAFEKEVGFESYRKINESNLAIDNLFATLINPEGIFQVGNFLLKIDFKKQKSYAFLLTDTEKELKSGLIINNVQAIEFNWEDDVFAILNNEIGLKSVTGSYCSGNQVNHNNFDFIVTKVEYNNYGVYHTLVSRIWSKLGSQYTLSYLKLKSVDSPYNPPIVPSGISSRCFWKHKKGQGNIIRFYERNNDWEIESRPYHGTRRLKGYRFDVEFWWKVNSWDALSYDHISIECKKY
jgi:hypothetical protein